MDVMLRGSSYAYMEEVAPIPTDGLPFDRLGAAAWDHPLYVMLAQMFLIFPGKEPTYRINLMSAVMAAIALGLTYPLMLLLVHDRWAAAVGVLGLAVSHTFWLHSVTSEVYTLNILLMALLIRQSLLWVKKPRHRELNIFSLVAGLGIANHRLFSLTVALALVYMALSSKKRGGQAAFSLSSSLSMIGLFLIGLAPWWIQFVRMSRILGMPLTLELAGTFSLIGRRLSVGSWQQVAENLAVFFGWLVYQFTPLGIALGVFGFIWLWKKDSGVAKFFSGLVAAHIAFSANFSVADNFDFHMPSYWVFSFWIACGAAWLQTRLATAVSPARAARVRASVMAGIVLLPVSLYAIAPRALNLSGLSETDLGIYPIGTGARDTLSYFLNPDKRGDNSAARFGRMTLEELAPRALVLTPKTSEQEAYVILRYFQRVEGLRPDVRIDMMLFTPINDMPEAVLAQVKSQIRCRPIYITSLNPASFPIAALKASYSIINEANLLRVIPQKSVDEIPECDDMEEGWKTMSMQELVSRALRWK